MLPPIRYPLPTLVLLLVLGLLAWRGESMTRPWRSALAERWHRQFEGPPVPNSTEPKVVAGPIVRRALLLHDDVAAAALPGGTPTEQIRLRMFVDIYDVWPLTGVPEYYRVGNRRPIGWVKGQDLLPWETRLVVHRPEQGSSAADAQPSNDSPRNSNRRSFPVLSWTADTIEIADWDDSQPWQTVKSRVQLRIAELRPEDWGIWISRPELLSLVRRTGPNPAEPPATTRLRALLGRLSDDRPISAADQSAAKAFLLPQVHSDRNSILSLLESNESLARVNENWQGEASWGGLSFQFVPLSCLP